jgi:hypothetical protein
MMAASRGYSKTVEALIIKKADVDARNEYRQYGIDAVYNV